MRIDWLVKISLISLIVGTLFCALFHQSQKTDRGIRKEIIKGKSTETMILNLLGLPSSVTTNSIGDEVWNYKNISYATTTSVDGNVIILWELSTGESNEPDKPFDLLITFDQNDIVKDFEKALVSF